jgi:hypothetical protein
LSWAFPRHQRLGQPGRYFLIVIVDRVIDRIAGHERGQHTSDTQSVSRPPAVTTPLSAISRDHAGP